MSRPIRARQTYTSDAMKVARVLSALEKDVAHDEKWREEATAIGRRFLALLSNPTPRRADGDQEELEE